MIYYNYHLVQKKKIRILISIIEYKIGNLYLLAQLTMTLNFNILKAGIQMEEAENMSFVLKTYIFCAD